MKVTGFGLSDVGRKRSRNEDSFLVSDAIRLYVVADGMGGHSGGEYASRLSVATMEEVLGSMHSDPDATVIAGVNSEETEYGDRLRYAIEVAGEKIFDQALYDPELKGMGTTITAVIFDKEGNAFIANVGDSRVYLLRDGQIQQVTEDHSLVSEQIKAGILDQNDAKRHSMKNIITRSVGYQEQVDIDVTRMTVQAGDRFLLCSDGLSNLIDDATLLSLGAGADMPQACRQLIDLANDRGGDDNITVVLCEVMA